MRQTKHYFFIYCPPKKIYEFCHLNEKMNKRPENISFRRNYWDIYPRWKFTTSAHTLRYGAYFCDKIVELLNESMYSNKSKKKSKLISYRMYRKNVSSSWVGWSTQMRDETKMILVWKILLRETMIVTLREKIIWSK